MVPRGSPSMAAGVSHERVGREGVGHEGVLLERGC